MDLLGLAALHQVGSLSHTDLEPTDAHSFLQVPSASRGIYSYTVIYALDLHSKHVSMFLSAWKKDENMTKPLQPSDS